LDKSQTNPWLVLAVVCAGVFMILLDITIVNIAIPSIVDSLDASLDQILWVINGYILSYAVLLITAGRLGDMCGQRALFAAGLVVFTVSSAFCGFAQNTDQLIAGRVLQGIGGALLTPQTLAIMTTIFPSERRGAAFGIWGAVAGVSTITGPTVGGYIVTNWGWHWIFFINVPIGLLALVATFLIVPDLRPGRSHHLGIIGVILASLGLLGILFGLIEGQRHDWGVVWEWVTIPMIIAAGIVVLIAFALWERWQSEPLVPGILLQNRNFVIMNWVVVTMSFGMLGLFLPITIYFQSVLGMTALNAGLTMVPMSITSMFVAPVAGRLADKTGGKYLVMLGLLLFAVGMALVAYLASPVATGATFVLPLVVAGFGMGCIFAPMAMVAMRDISPQVAGAASGVFTMTRQLGAVIGSAAVGAVLQNRLAAELKDKTVVFADQLPPEFRQPFIDGFANAGSDGLEVGPSQTGSFDLPADVPAQVVEQLQQIAQEVFANAFVAAARPTLALPIAVLLVGFLAAFAIDNRRKEISADSAEPEEPTVEPAGASVSS